MTATLRTRRMPRLLTAGVCALAAVSTSILVVDRPEAASAAGSGAPSVGVPAYFWPGSLWTQLLASGPEVQYVILNPESGPGAQKIIGFADAVTSAKGSGKHVVAYVDTSYGARSIAAVKADIDTYRTWYGVNEFFLDQTPFSCEGQPYYDEVRAYINTQPGGLVVMNPGVNALECWMTEADVLVNFEGSEASYANWTPAAYTANYPAQKFWQIVYAADPTHGEALMATAQERRAGVVYITDDSLPNPFDTLPSAALWNAQVPSNVPPTTTTTTTTTAVAPTTTEAPMTTTSTAAPTTSTSTAPTPTTAAPVSTTLPPAPTTQPPAPTTAAPVSTTAAPTPTTAAPVSTTAAPTPTTAAPVSTTLPPAPTTQPPAPTTAAPVPTTASPTAPPPAPTTAAPTPPPPAPTTQAPTPTTQAPKPTVPVATTTVAPTTTAPRVTVPPTTKKPKAPVRTTTTTTRAPRRVVARLATNKALITRLVRANRS